MFLGILFVVVDVFLFVWRLLYCGCRFVVFEVIILRYFFCLGFCFSCCVLVGSVGKVSLG